MKIVTSGRKYIDIDAYAGIIAYSYLLNLKGIQAKAVSTSVLNESITSDFLNLNFGLDEYEKSDDDEFIIIDVSNKDFFDNIVAETKIIEVIDHHTGFENFWKDRLGENVKIEFIGSVATLIFEEYEKENMVSKIPKEIAILLMAAILDNTLNLKAQITNKRDIDAYNKLSGIAGIKEDFEERYFLECQKTIEKNLEESIKNDTKIEKTCNILPNAFSQLVLWNKEIAFDNIENVRNILDNISDEWMINIISLKDGKSYLLSNNKDFKRSWKCYLKKLLKMMLWS